MEAGSRYAAIAGMLEIGKSCVVCAPTLLLLTLCSNRVGSRDVSVANR